MYNFEYVTKAEYSPVKKSLINLINQVQDEVRNHFTFRFDFIGSASRNMITCDYSMNTGYDFDIDIRVNDDDKNFSPKQIKNIIREAFDKHGFKHDYSFAEDSKRVLTIKFINHNNSKIIHSCDFAIVHDGKDGQQYIHFNKYQNTYEWQYQPKEHYEVFKKTNKLKKQGKWTEVRNEYLRMKNENKDKNKKSRHIYEEVINNLYKKYF